jgi:elongation factor Ts
MISASLVKELRETSGAGMMDCKAALAETNGDIEKAMDYLREKGIAKANKKASRIASEGLANIYVDGNKAVILEVNSETDFVSQNEEFKNMLDEIGNALLKSDAKTIEEANQIKTTDSTIGDLIIAKTSKIGEKLSFRRFAIVTKSDEEVFGPYLHLGGRIATLIVLKGANEAVAKDVAMQAAAMKPGYLFSKDVPADEVAREKEVLKEQAMNEGKPADIAEKMVEGRIRKYFQEICLADQAFIKDGNVDIKTYVTNNGGELVSMIRYEVGEGLEKRSEDFAAEVMKQIG